MNSAGIFLLGALLLSLLGAVAFLNFFRYRFKGDKTVLFVILFITAFIASAGLTLALLKPETAATTRDDMTF